MMDKKDKDQKRPNIIVEVRKLKRVIPRSLTKGMVEPLIYAYEFHPHIDGKWINFDDVLVKRGIHDVNRDWTRLKYWRFIEKKPGERNDGSPNTGFWRITSRGERFLRGDSFLAVSYVLEDTCYAQSDGKYHYDWPFNGHYLPLEVSDIHKARGKRFRFDELR